MDDAEANGRHTEHGGQGPEGAHTCADVGPDCIYGELLHYCQRFRFSGRITFLTPDENVYKCPEVPAAVLADLSANYSADRLVESGVADRTADGALIIAPALSDPEGMFIALREPESGRIVELLTEFGCLSGADLPVFSVMADRFTRVAAGHHAGDLFLAHSLSDVVMLRALDCAATLAQGLDVLDLRQAQRLFESLRLQQRQSNRDVEQTQQTGSADWNEDDDEEEEDDDDDDDEDEQVDSDPNATDSQNVVAGSSGEPCIPAIEWKLILVGWSPSMLEKLVPPTIATVAQHLEALEMRSGLVCTEMYLWLPNVGAVEGLNCTAQHGDVAGMRQMLHASIDESSSNSLDAISGDQTAPRARPQGFAAALTRLREYETAPQQRGTHEPHQAWRDMVLLLDIDVIQPLMQEAMAATSAPERVLRMNLAEISRMFHLYAARMGSQLSGPISRPGTDVVGALPQEQIKNLLAMSDRVLGLSRAIEKHS